MVHFSRKIIWPWMALAVLIGLPIAWIVGTIGVSGAVDRVILGIKEFFYWPLLVRMKNIVLTPTFVIILAATLLLERLFPADKNQKPFSLSFAHDIVWFFLQTIGNTIIVATYVYFLETYYKSHLTHLTITIWNQYPEWVAMAAWIIVTDFLYYLQHYINHKVPVFWYFHTIHHSQKNINFFTDFRYHMLEYVVRYTILTVPMLMFDIDAKKITYFLIFQTWYTRFYHGNIRTNLGVLRYILVTPQSHRIHHSKEGRHRDKNFGSILSIWDYLFGTQHRGYEEYPETGIDDHQFPHEASFKGISLIVTPLKQLIYPFQLIYKNHFVRNKKNLENRGQRPI